MLQNMQLILTNFTPKFTMPKLKHNSHTNRITGDSIEMRMNWNSQVGDVVVWQQSDPHMLMNNHTLSTIRNAYESGILSFAQTCRNQSTVKCFYYSPVTVQREMDWAHNTTAPYVNAITYTRMKQLASWGLQAAIKHDVQILNGSITAAHWWGSWDGLHYSEMASHYHQGDNYNWVGGVSMMITQMLINSVCNDIVRD